MLKLNALYVAGWSYYVGRIHGTGYVAQAWRDLPKPVRDAQGNLKFRECYVGTGVDPESAALACAGDVGRAREAGLP
jgi:hypothetical protein